MKPLHGTRCLVTGGSGFVGRRLVEALLAQGARVRVLDRLRPEAAHVDAHVGDIADPATAARACADIDLVFHTACVMALHEHAPARVRRDARRTNVDGTATLLAASAAAGVRRFVFTSSNHVVLGDAPIFGGDERLPYADDARDIYTRTKIAAECLVLAAHDASSPSGLRTCALRPGGIYGPGDAHFVPRIVRSTRLLRRRPRLGPRSALVDLTHVDNLVHAHLLAAERLASHTSIGGRAFFISDGSPITVDDFGRHVLAAIGHHHPGLGLPQALLHRTVGAWERLWARALLPRPPLAPARSRPCRSRITSASTGPAPSSATPRSSTPLAARATPPATTSRATPARSGQWVTSRAEAVELAAHTMIRIKVEHVLEPKGGE